MNLGPLIVAYPGPADAPPDPQSYAFTEREVVFADQPNTAIASGALVIDGLPFVAQVAALDTLAIVNGAGLTFQAGAATTAWTNSQMSATVLSLQHANLYAELGCDARAVLIVEIYASALSLTANALCSLSLYGVNGSPGGSASRLGASLRTVAGASQVWKGQANANFGFNLVDPTVDAWGLQSWGHGSLSTFGGTYGPSYPAEYLHGMGTGQINTFNSVRDGEAFTGIAFPTGGVSGLYTATIERVRWRAYQPVG